MDKIKAFYEADIWVAYYVDDNGIVKRSSVVVGYGGTKEDAIADLKYCWD